MTCARPAHDAVAEAARGGLQGKAFQLAAMHQQARRNAQLVLHPRLQRAWCSSTLGAVKGAATLDLRNLPGAGRGSRCEACYTSRTN